MPDLAMVPDRFGIASIFAAACNQRDNVACAMPVSAESRDAEIACGGRSRATIRALIVSEYGFIFSRFFSPAVHVVRSATLPRSGCNYADRAGFVVLGNLEFEGRRRVSIIRAAYPDRGDLVGDILATLGLERDDIILSRDVGSDSS